MLWNARTFARRVASYPCGVTAVELAVLLACGWPSVGLGRSAATLALGPCGARGERSGRLSCAGHR
eukprot:15222765-Alexandrium_andersonii.AAC.1